MATSSNQLTTNQLADEFLTCSLCLDLFKQPRVLPCQHTFCFVCIQGYTLSIGNTVSFNCPVCRTTVIIPGGDINNLKSNYLVESLLSFVAKQQTLQQTMQADWTGGTVAQNCEACEEERITETFCSICTLWLCSTCTKTHNKLPSTKSHPTVSIDDVVNKAKEKLMTVQLELQQLCSDMDSRYLCILTEQEFLENHASQMAQNIEQAWKKVHNALIEKKNGLLQQLAVKLSDGDGKLQTRLSQMDQKRLQVRKALDFVNGLKCNENARLIASMMNHVEMLRTSTHNIEMPSGSVEETNFEFQATESLFKEVQHSSLGYMFSGVSASKPASYPPNRNVIATHRIQLAYSYYITGVAMAKNETVFVVSNCDSFRMITKGQEMDLKHLKKLLKKPWGVVLAPSSELIVTDCGDAQGCGSVNIISLEGKLENQIANGLSVPRGVAVDKHGRIYVCDEVDRCVYVMTPKGRIVKILKRCFDGTFIFDAPRFVTVDKNGRIVVSDNGKFVKIFDENLQPMTQYQSAVRNSEFWDVVTDSAGYIFVADWNHGVHVLSPEGVFQGFLKKPHLTSFEPSAVTILPNDSLLVGTSNGEIIGIQSQ